MYPLLFPYILGAFMAWITLYPARSLPARKERRFFTIIITVVALGFLGFPLTYGDQFAIASELAAAVLFIALILLAWKVSPWFLPLVWFLHGAWDIAYLFGHVSVDKPRWVVELCVPYDWILAVYLLKRVPAWRSETR